MEFHRRDHRQIGTGSRLTLGVGLMEVSKRETCSNARKAPGFRALSFAMAEVAIRSTRLN